MVTLFVVILALPMLSGQWLAAPHGDQYSSGYAFDAWETAEWRETGRIPLWNPMIMGGLPYIAVVTHGDTLYPTALLRIILPAHVVMNLSFILHYILAGFLTYLFLRRFAVSWTGAVTGALAYQLTGLMLSYVHPGHDGKLFVSALLPLALIGLVAALRDRRPWGYPVVAVAVGLCLLSPHVQATYYALIAAGLFALYLTVGERTAEPLAPRLGRLGLALGAVLAGFALALPQILPFIEYIPHSPRAGGYSVGYGGSTSYGIPWDHVPELFLAGFTGEAQTYWGSNPLKLHSEYLGLPVIALAVLGFGDPRRRLVWWLAGIGLLFLLISLGGATPFYRIWWTIMPYVRKTRAPGMVFFVVAFCTAAFAAFGVHRLERGEGGRHVRAWLIAAGVVALLGLTGIFGRLAVGMAPVFQGRADAAVALGGAIRLSALIGAIALAALALLALGLLRGRVPALAFALGLPLIVGLDLWRDGRRFWVYSDPPAEGLYRPDPIVTRLQAEPKPFRVLDVGVYPHNVLMAHGIPQVLGYQGQELRYYDELLGGRNEWRYLLASTRLWDLLAVRFLLLPDSGAVPGFHRVLGPVQTAAATRGYLYEADTAPPYVRVVPAAAKVDDEAIPPTLADPRMPGYDRVVLLPLDAPVNPPPVTSWPAAIAARGTVTAWRPGALSIALDPAPTDSSYVLVSENWYLDWRASVDGRAAPLFRGDHALLVVRVPPGAKTVDLTYHSNAYATGKAIGLITLLLILASFIVPPVLERRRRG
ncbi:MAG: hypothetical protein Q8Q14_00920 [Gemmatimonadales bacterium]|nr:hypothetical protein [Gemmatimonadales bacterium]